MPSSHGILSMVKSNMKMIVCMIFFSVFAQTSNLTVVSSADYTGMIREEYNKKLVELGDKANNPAARQLHFKVQLDWYKSKMQDFVYLKRNDGNFDAVVANIVDKFDHLVSSHSFC
jgi:hypothetical protein